MKTLWQDLRYGARMLWRNPGFTAVAVLTLGLAIGANTILFTAASALLIRPLPIKNPQGLVFVWSMDPQSGRDRAPVSLPDFVGWRDQNRSFEDLAALRSGTMNLTGLDIPMRVASMSVTPNLFSLWGIQTVLGRPFRAQEERPGVAPVAIVSHGFWVRHLGSDPAAIGRTVKLDGVPFTLIGVLDPAMEFGRLSEIEVWTPLTMEVSRAHRDDRDLMVTGRLKVGVSQASAAAEMKMIGNRLEREYPDTNSGWGINTVSLSDELAGVRTRLVLVLLGTVVLFILLIASANIANLQLARGAARFKEVAIRMAVGASRPRLVRQLLTENILIGLSGGVFGLLMAMWGRDLMVIVTRGINPLINQMLIDWRVLLFTVALSILSPLIFGLWPAVRSSRRPLNEALKEGGRAEAGVSGQRARSSLVVIQLALALMLLAMASLVVRTAIALQKIDEGFSPRNLLTLRIELPAFKYSSDYATRAFYERVLEQVRNIPGVRSAAVTSVLPVADTEPTVPLTIEGRTPASPRERPWAAISAVSSDYFQVMGIPLVKGRYFSASDGAESAPVALISRVMAERYWPQEDPIGRRIALGGSALDAPAFQVAGVVGDIRNSDIDAPKLPQMYVPAVQRVSRAMALVARTESGPLDLIGDARRAVEKVDPEQPIFDVKSMQQMIYDDLSDTYLLAGIFATFALIALVMAASGVYGVISYSVSQRTREFGIRMALGADAWGLVRMILGQGSRLVLVAIVLGLGGGFALARLMSSLLYGVTPKDTTTWIGISVTLAAVALLACYLPARRATKIDPMAALRYE